MELKFNKINKVAMYENELVFKNLKLFENFNSAKNLEIYKKKEETGNTLDIFI